MQDCEETILAWGGWSIYTITKPQMTTPVRILKSDENHKTITYVILEPESVDRNWDIITADEIIKTAHEFALNLSEKYINMNHLPNTKQHWVMFVESFVLPVPLVYGMDVVKAWSWLVAFKFYDEDLYQKVLDWDIVWVSLEWWAYTDDE